VNIFTIWATFVICMWSPLHGLAMINADEEQTAVFRDSVRTAL
jgi:hypothetical protein